MWWNALVDYAKVADVPSKQPPPLPETATHSTLTPTTPESVSHPHSSSEAFLNPARLSGTGHTSFNWNDRWQNVCDAICEDSKMDSSSVLEITSQYCEGMKNEMNAMRERIFYHFLCPESIRSYLKDGFNDRDCSYYSENGSLFIIPMHVGSVKVLNKGARFSE